MRAWFRRWFPGSGKARYAATYPTAEVEHGGVTYTIRELSVGERTAFDEFSKANDTAPVLIMAWLLCQACDQFRDHNPADLALHCGPGALAKLSDAIIRQSGMHGEAVEDAEKIAEQPELAFAHRLAGHLGCCVSDLEVMSHREYVQWAAYARHEPFGPAVDDWHHARTQAVIINAVQTALYAMGRAKHRRPVNPSDFMYSRPKTQDEKLRNLNAGLSALASRGSSSEH